ncbi:uncharacterized protein BDZ83DRAFT_602694 [Colletotrichum acutatum]|uniref:Uncharacterized protein n=1 Tax=Glomerella acutata TaxID=27357 RepID=A0AAD9D186_GLOAC|nr:uncharacterized protein BDZ83DRAFT_602694 [Colletotrichum acutatum]KAK1730418.1 hypothetical protein BDZ83DRAFT_602694 [Colletotrichum acutatum]
MHVCCDGGFFLARAFLVHHYYPSSHREQTTAKVVNPGTCLLHSNCCFWDDGWALEHCDDYQGRSQV